MEVSEYYLTFPLAISLSQWHRGFLQQIQLKLRDLSISVTFSVTLTVTNGYGVLDYMSVNTTNTQKFPFNSEEFSLSFLLRHGDTVLWVPRILFATCKLVNALGFNLSLCVLRRPCQAGHHHSCSQVLSLVKGPHCRILLSASTSNKAEEGEMWKNTCTHFSGKARIGRRAVPQAGNTFPNLRPEEKHFVQEPKWVVVNKTVLLLLLELEPRRFWILMEDSQQPPVSAFYTTGTKCLNTFISPQVSSFWNTTQAGQPADVRFISVSVFSSDLHLISWESVWSCVSGVALQVVTVGTGCVRLDGSRSVWVSILAFWFFLSAILGLMTVNKTWETQW